MSKLYSNPFFWGIPVSGNRYIPRPQAEEQVRTCIEKGRSIILTGKRGSGKTSLVQTVTSNFTGELLYLDLSFVVDRASLIRLLAETIRAVIPVLRDKPELKVAQDADSAAALTDIFQILRNDIKERDKKVLIIWDEFQHILKLKEDVLSDIKKGMNGRDSFMNALVSHREDLLLQAFMKKAESNSSKFCHVRLDRIDTTDFRSFLSRNFRRLGLNDFDLPDAVLQFTEGHAFLTQRFASSVASCWLEGTTTRLKDRALQRLLEEEDAAFSNHWDQFGVNEKRLLLGLAHGYSRPTELSFIDRFGLSATSTAHNTVQKLLREGWLVNRNEGYYIYDPLFRTWLKNRNNLG